MDCCIKERVTDTGILGGLYRCLDPEHDGKVDTGQSFRGVQNKAEIVEHHAPLPGFSD